MKITLFTLGALLCFLGVQGQSFTIGNGSVSTCNGYFYDSGGSAGEYKPNEDLIYTVNNPFGIAELSVEFMEFALGDGDWLSVYEGQVDESSLIDTYDKNNLLKTKLSTTKGSFIFVFHSDGAGSGQGWKAVFSCPGSSQIPAVAYNGPAVILIYSVRGIKSQSDVAMLDKHLKTLGLAFETSFNIEKENAWITADQELTYKIKDALLDTKNLLGYEIAVDYQTRIQTKTK